MFRFTIRDLLWLMVVVGVGIALCVQSYRARNSREEAAESNRRLIEVRASLQEQKRQNQGLIKAIEERDADALKAARIVDDANRRLDPKFPIYYPPSTKAVGQ
jgi:hypothetical protein